MVFGILLPVMLLFANPYPMKVAKAFLVYLVVSALLQRLPQQKGWKDIRHIAGSVPIAGLGSYTFYGGWYHSRKAQAVARILHLPFSPFLLCVALIIAVCAVPGIDFLIDCVDRLLASVMKSGPSAGQKRGGSALSRKELGFLILAAVVIISICSTSSPLYAFNTWVDANCFFTVGKSMLQGMVPYRDLFEQKGPLLYTLHALTSLVSDDSFLGVYFLEILCCFFFLVYASKLLRLFCRDSVLLLVPLLGAAVCASTAFQMGDSAEELCLPLLVYAGYVGVKALQENTLPSHREFFFLGITSACVLWIKYTILGFYLGWIVAPACLALSQRRFGELLKKLGVLIVGIFTVTLPFLLYFGWNHALPDLFEVYFYDNIFLYSNMESSNSFLKDTLAGLYQIKQLFPIGAVAVLLGTVWCWYRCSRLVFVSHIATCAGLLLTVFGGGRYYAYYSLAFGATAVFGIGALYDIAVFSREKLKEPFRSRGCAATALALCCALLLADSPNIAQMQYPAEEYPQFQVKAAIAESGIEDPTLLNYGFLDGGFYTVTGIYPSIRFFCKTNLPLAATMEQQNECLEKGSVDFVVSLDEVDHPNYHLIGIYHGFEEFTDYFLYQRNA